MFKFLQDQQERGCVWKDLMATDIFTEYVLILRNFLAIFFTFSLNILKSTG